jgi:hypothetical protein
MLLAGARLEPGSSSSRGMAGRAVAHSRIKRRTAVPQLDDVVSFEIGRILAAGLAIFAPLELELGDQAAPGPPVVDWLIGFRLSPGGPGVDCL